MRSTRWAAAGAAAIAVTLLAAGCTSSTTSSPEPPKLSAASSIGKAEGKLNLLVWAGYAENGSTDPTVDWVTPFQKATGCKTNVQVANTSDDMFEKMGTGDFDLVSASGDSSLRMIYAGKVAPVNTSLFTNYNDLASFTKDQKWNSVNGQAYGIPHGWGANLLAWRTDKVTKAPDSWSVVWEKNSPYKGKLTAYDSPTTIADAAVYLKATKPELKITDPYALDKTQFAAAVALAKQQQKNVAGYWSNYADAQKAFENGTYTAGTAWQIIVNLAQGNGAKVESTLPKEGSTGWADTWMIDAKSPHPNCAYKWMNWITTPKVQAQVASWFGEAPANLKACDLTAADGKNCTVFHAKDEAYFKDIAFWATPQATCLDGRRDVQCVPYSEWTTAWSSIRNS